MKQKENIECKFLINNVVSLFLRRCRRRLYRAGGHHSRYVQLAKYDGKLDELIEKTDAIMYPNDDAGYRIDADFLQSVWAQIELMHCTTQADAETRYKLMINDITIQKLLTNE